MFENPGGGQGLPGPRSNAHGRTHCWQQSHLPATLF